MAKRIHNLAKELGVKSKAIIEKCVAEGIPQDSVKNHMATVSPGLEATIREWFSEEGTESVTTAVETTPHVDLEKVRAKPRRAAARRKASPGAAEDTPETPTQQPAHAGGSNGAHIARAPDAGPGTQPTEPSAPAPASAPVQPVEPVPAPDATPEQDAPETAAPPEKSAEPLAPAASAGTPNEQSDGTGGAASTGGDDTAPTTKQPAQMNVPKRPDDVTPAGPRLQTPTSVKLSGPKVVRVEAPERIEPPRRPREPRVSDPSRMGGMGAGFAPTEDPGMRRGGGASGRGGKRGGPQTSRGGVPSRRRGRSDEGIETGKMFSEQDLIEREARLSRSGGFLKEKRKQMRRQGSSEQKASPAQIGGTVKIQAPFTIKDLSAATGVKGADIVKQLFMEGTPATINSGIDIEKAQELMANYDIELDITEAKSAEQVVTEQFGARKALDEQSRGPIVTILGHVDHGKTSLLDKIRHANVAEGEAGGITQATSAFRVPVEIGGEQKHILFLDTPGHEAFTSMRARGAQITDIVVLVVSAPEGVMPQTIESINHAKAAGVPIIVALNKIDRPDATDSRINQTLSQLAEAGLNPSEWGGETDVIRTSAQTGQGIDDLLETLDLQGQMLELKADYAGPARGTIVEAQVVDGRGPVANVVVQDGELSVGDFIVAGRGFGKVRDIVDDRGERHKSVGPATPVQISGLDEVPGAGDKFFIVDSLKKAQDAAEQRRWRDREAQLAQPKVTLDSLLSQMKEADLKEILVVLKADVQGSVDVIKQEIEKVQHEEVKVRVLHAAVGGITDSDVLLADASRAVIIGFNVIPSGKAKSLADEKKIEIRTYRVIYDITDDIRKAAEGMLEPELREEVLGHAEVRAVFKITRVGAIAGCYVTDGVVERDSLIRVTRNDIVIEHDRKLEQLKRHKDDAKEVRAGTECGMKIAGYDDIKEGDILECYKNIQVKRTL